MYFSTDHVTILKRSARRTRRPVPAIKKVSTQTGVFFQNGCRFFRFRVTSKNEVVTRSHDAMYASSTLRECEVSVVWSFSVKNGYNMGQKSKIIACICWRTWRGVVATMTDAVIAREMKVCSSCVFQNTFVSVSAYLYVSMGLQCTFYTNKMGKTSLVTPWKY